MLTPKSRVNLLDINESKNLSLTVDELFSKYAIKLTGTEQRVITNTSDTIYLDPAKFDVRIEDDYGWTGIKSICKLNVINPANWVKVIIFISDRVPEMHIIMNRYDIIPLVNPEEESIGFHGERKYTSIGIEIDDLMNIEKFAQWVDWRVQAKIRDEEDTGFARIVAIEPLKTTDDIVLPTYGFIIETISGSFTYERIRLRN